MPDGTIEVIPHLRHTLIADAMPIAVHNKVRIVIIIVIFCVKCIKTFSATGAWLSEWVSPPLLNFFFFFLYSFPAPLDFSIIPSFHRMNSANLQLCLLIVCSSVQQYNLSKVHLFLAVFNFYMRNILICYPSSISSVVFTLYYLSQFVDIVLCYPLEQLDIDCPLLHWDKYNNQLFFISTGKRWSTGTECSLRPVSRTFSWIRSYLQRRCRTSSAYDLSRFSYSDGGKCCIYWKWRENVFQFFH